MPVVGSLDVWLDENEDEKQTSQSTRAPPQQPPQHQQQKHQSSTPAPQLLPNRPNSDTSPLVNVLEIKQTSSQTQQGEASLPHHSTATTTASERIGLPIPRSPRSTRGKHREDQVSEPSSPLTAPVATGTAPPAAPSPAPSSSSPSPSSDSSPYNSDAGGRASSDRTLPLGLMHRRRFSLLSRQLSQSATLAETGTAAPAPVADPYSDRETKAGQSASSAAAAGPAQKGAVAAAAAVAAASFTVRTTDIEKSARETAAAAVSEPSGVAAAAVTAPLDLDPRLNPPGAMRVEEASAAARETNTAQQAVALTAPVRLARVSVPFGGGGGIMGSVGSSSGGNDSSHGGNSSSSESVQDDSIRGSSSGGGDSVLAGEAWAEQLLVTAVVTGGNHPPPVGRSGSPGAIALHSDSAAGRGDARNSSSRNGGRNGGRGRGDPPSQPSSSSFPGRSNISGAAYTGSVCGPLSASPRAAFNHSLSGQLTPGELSACASLIATAAISVGVTLPLPGLTTIEIETITAPTVTAPTAAPISPSRSELEELRPNGNNDVITAGANVTTPQGSGMEAAVAAAPEMTPVSDGAGGGATAVWRVVTTSGGVRQLLRSGARQCTAMSSTSVAVHLAEAPAGDVEAAGMPRADVSAADKMQPQGVPCNVAGGALGAAAAAGTSSSTELLVTGTEPPADNAARAIVASAAAPVSLYTATAAAFAAAAAGIALGRGADVPFTSDPHPSPPVALPPHTLSCPQPASLPYPFPALTRGPNPTAAAITTAAAAAAARGRSSPGGDRPQGPETLSMLMSSSEGSEGLSEGSLFGLPGSLSSSLPAWAETFEGTLRGGWPRRDPSRRGLLMRQDSAPAATVLSVLRRGTSSLSCASSGAPPPLSDGRVE